MGQVVLVRAADQLTMGVRWSGCRVSGTGAARLLIGSPQGRLVLILPPQHIGEEASPPGSPAPAQLPTGGGATVPVWSGTLSAPTRLAFAIPEGVSIPLTVEGVLTAALERPLLVSSGPPASDDSAIELPWRLVIAPIGASGVVCRHLTGVPDTATTGLWRTRVVDAGGAGLGLRVADESVAGRADPAFASGNALPLARGDRQRLFLETGNRPARLDRLELSALGGTLDATGAFDNFEWEHHARLGRDMHVRTLTSGVLYPLGHRAEFVKATERVFDATAGGAAVLRTVRVLTILDPVRETPRAGRVSRAFPFGDVEITRSVFRDLAEAVPETTTLPGVGPVGTHFWPTTLDGQRVRFPVACTTSSGVVRMDLPLLFVMDLRPATDSLGSPVLAQRLAAEYGEVSVPVAPMTIDVTGSDIGLEGPDDAVSAAAFQEVRRLTVRGAETGEGLDLASGYRPKVVELELGMPSLRALRGDDPRARVRFATKYLENGREDVVLEMLPTDAIAIDFSKAADRSGGLLALQFRTNAISRTLGPVDRFALPDPATGLIDAAKLFPSDSATLLGFPLKALLSQVKVPPTITVTPMVGRAPEVRMQWTGIRLASAGAFRAKGSTTTLDLTVVAAPDKSETVCTVRDFVLEMPPGPKAVLRISFSSVTFSQRDGRSPRVDVSGVEVAFTGDLSLVQGLAEVCDLGRAGEGLEVTPSGLAMRYSLPVPPVSTGVFTMRNIAFAARIEVPFDGRPITITLGFSSRLSPFQLGVMMFGGGGYLELELDRKGLRRFEAALEFGAFVAIDFVVARGEVHALGGVRFILEHDGAVSIAGYLRIGGCVSVLGLISVSVELCLSMTYVSERNALVGRATLVIEIDLTLWSESVELDSGLWELAGEEDRGPVPSPLAFAAPELALQGLAQWVAYRAAFAREE